MSLRLKQYLLQACGTINTFLSAPIKFMGRAKQLPAPALLTLTGACVRLFMNQLEFSFQPYYQLRERGEGGWGGGGVLYSNSPSKFEHG